MSTTEYERIPQPPEHLFGLLGNLPDVDPSFVFKEVWRLQQLYGPIMKLALPKDRIFVSSQKLVNELCDTKRFAKQTDFPTIQELRPFLGDGLFTAKNEEVNWGKAHRLLVPAFGPLGIRKMFGGMQDIASQMVLRWDRLGSENVIESSDDLTRLAFDTIGLCAFSFRFNQFYSESVHPFARQMGEVLLESGQISTKPTWIRPLYRKMEQQILDKVRDMHKLCDEIVADRKQHPQPDNHDLLNTMLYAEDRETGEKLSDENIRFQLATFLTAGHETTSATLSFNYYNLLKNPDKLLKAQAQVDEILGDRIMTVEDLPKLTYIDACIKETLRLSSPINGSTLASKEDQVLGGKYFIPANTPVTIDLRLLHRDKEVWGEDVEVFRPERWLNGGLAAFLPNSWKPFGTGVRSCIGRGFAEQEMMINVAMVLQHFQIEMADPSYELQMKSTLTIKPLAFKMKVRRRPGKDLYTGIPGGVQQEAAKHVKQEEVTSSRTDGEGKPLAIFFGGNSGTCESFAQTLQAATADHGFHATVDNLDTATEHFPQDRPVVVITSSYEGLPPDNAKKFTSWLENIKSDILKGASFAVFGVGNSDWADTFHRIPKLVDRLLGDSGGTRLLEAGFSNAKEDLVGPWEEWLIKLLTTLSDGEQKAAQVSSSVDVKITANPMTQPGNEKQTFGTVLENKQIASTAVGPAKRHLEIRLPEDMQYTAGDYLVVQASNPPESVHRALAFFGLNAQDLLSFSGSRKKHLPTEPTLVAAFLYSAVDLGTPISKTQLEAIVIYAEGRADVASLSHATLLEKRYSVLDVLEEHSVSLPFSRYVDMLPPLAPRQYSISSSPLHQPDTASLTIDVHESAALSGHGIFHGVASSYLATRRVGDRIPCIVRQTKVGFRLPSSPGTPVIMVAAGTGIAPMRGFLQERAAIATAEYQRDRLGPAILYFGCRDENEDFIYKDELKGWEKEGIVKVRTAFSKTEPKHYVPDVMWEGREELRELFKAGGKIFLCGSAARLGKSVGDVCKRIHMEGTGGTMEEAETWLQGIKTDRYVSDVY